MPCWLYHQVQNGRVQLAAWAERTWPGAVRMNAVGESTSSGRVMRNVWVPM